MKIGMWWLCELYEYIQKVVFCYISLFSVRPPKKTWKIISNLSGGEKTLSSLALVFALHYYKPTPLYVMDEIDAALDFKNVSIVGHYIKVCVWRQGEAGSWSHSRYFTKSFTKFYFYVILCGSIVNIRRLKYVQVCAAWHFSQHRTTYTTVAP